MSTRARSFSTKETISAGGPRKVRARSCGHLECDPHKGRTATIRQVEQFVTEFVTVEQGMMLQNLGLMAQALGLGASQILPTTSSPGCKRWVFAWNKCP
jgi:hypothetical protein